MHHVDIIVLQFLEIAGIVLHLAHLQGVLLEAVLLLQHLLEHVVDGIDAKKLDDDLEDPLNQFSFQWHSRATDTAAAAVDRKTMLIEDGLPQIRDLVRNFSFKVVQPFNVFVLLLNLLGDRRFQIFLGAL